MIVRILGEGQLELPDGAVDDLNPLDSELQTACESGDEEAFDGALGTLLGRVRELGSPLPDDRIEPSDLVLPSADASLAEVAALLTEEGLIPG